MTFLFNGIGLFLVNSIDWGGALYAVLVMGGVALLLALLIIVVSKVFEVKEDTKVKEIAEYLSGANCGGCGHPGCAGFAKALTEGKGKIDDCAMASKTDKIEIANILGISFAGGEKTTAVVACNGGVRCKDRYEYQGYGDCISQNIMAGGKKQCDEGCMGSGSCADACPSYAIEVKEGVARTNVKLCNSCGACIVYCPKKIIKRIPASAEVYVACSSTCRGKTVMAVCETGCTGCSLCVRACKEDAITMHNYVPVFDYAKCTNCRACISSCPRKVIKEVR
jgi:Na+-translocating ferredoxin:NAD+ oxidoreductase RNF subunit RnfB